MPHKALVIDNEAGMRQVISRILVPQGFSVLEADDAASGLDLCARENPDIILMDIRLPDMDGPDILAGLLKIKKDAPVIVLTGFGDIDAALELIKAGAVDHLSKPFKVDALIQLVNKSLSKKPIITAPNHSDIKETTSGRAEKKTVAPVQAVKTVQAERRKFPLKMLAAAACIVILAAGGYFAWKNFPSTEKAKVFDVRSAGPSALSCGAKGAVWIADWMAGEVSRYDPAPNIAFPGDKLPENIQPSGIAVDGTTLWASDSFEGKIHSIDTGAKFAIKASYASPGGSPSGLYHDGKNLWSLDFQASKAYRHDMDDKLSVAAAFDSPVKNPRALFGFDGSLYILGAQSGKLYKVRKDDFLIEGIFELPEYGIIPAQAVSMASDGKFIWMCCEGEAKLFRFDIKTLIKSDM